jgi:ankyrin repeat protein
MVTAAGRLIWNVKPACHRMPEYPYNLDNGQTDLMGAAYNADVEEVGRILSMPCDVDAQDSHGMTALMYAAMQGHVETVQQLIEKKADLELQSGQRWTALMYAVRKGHVSVVQALLTAKADPDVHGDYDTFETPLTLAAWRGHYAIVRALVGAGANVGLHGGCGQATAECIARHQGHHEISEYLLYHEKKPTA